MNIFVILALPNVLAGIWNMLTCRKLRFTGIVTYPSGRRCIGWMFIKSCDVLYFGIRPDASQCDGEQKLFLPEIPGLARDVIFIDPEVDAGFVGLAQLMAAGDAVHPAVLDKVRPGLVEGAAVPRIPTRIDVPLFRHF